MTYYLVTYITGATRRVSDDIPITPGEVAANHYWLALVDGRWILINLSHVLSIEEEPVTEATSGVVTPPSPAQIKAEKEQQEQQKAPNLEEQLANPEVGK